MKSHLSTINLLGVSITSETEETILKYILNTLRKTKEKFFIVTPNPEIIVYANKHSDYKDKLNAAKISLPDGTGIFLAAILWGKLLPQRVPGVDFIDYFCSATKDQPVSMGFLGGRAGVAKKTVERLKQAYPWIDIVFVGEEWSKEYLYERERRKGAKAQSPREVQSAIDILFVAFGFPKQEEWIYENLDRLPIRCAMGVGGAFDYLSGYVSRAPFWVRAAGFEWLYRLQKEPWRWRRQVALIEFVWIVLKERLRPK